MSRKRTANGQRMGLGFTLHNPEEHERIRDVVRTKSPKQLEREADDAEADRQAGELLRRDTVELRPARRAT